MTAAALTYLVFSLGHPQYSVREAASATLRRLDSFAITLATRHEHSPDAEIAHRCRAFNLKASLGRD